MRLFSVLTLIVLVAMTWMVHAATRPTFEFATNPAQTTSTIAISNTDRLASAEAKPCTYSGREYSDGSIVCQNGMEYRCDNGSWTSLSRECPKYTAN